ncbi:DUF397 domain-containing protein [Streptomyces sp. NPDC051109]|uniref:DUF397 domain-containing protein n=1 Tax=Streptomyces sp. NPDC051109 TaxID=3365642 RepID=UPI0037B65302
MNSSPLRWFKSSYSGSQGDSCVEVALSWHKSTYSSGDGDNCVEVAACADAVHIRDSKVPAGPELAVHPTTWAAFLGGVTGA